METLSIVPVLQTAIGPMILISGIGLLLLTMTNRLGRSIERARILVAGKQREEPSVQRQIEIIWVRARLLRMAILLSSISALCAALLIILLFLSALMGINLGWLIGFLFVLGMLALIGSLILFIQDVNQSLTALRFELQTDRKATQGGVVERSSD